MKKDHAHVKDYWRGYRRAKIHVFLAGLEHLPNLDAESGSTYESGYAAGIEACKNELSELIRKDGDYEFK